MKYAEDVESSISLLVNWGFNHDNIIVTTRVLAVKLEADFSSRLLKQRMPTSRLS